MYGSYSVSSIWNILADGSLQATLSGWLISPILSRLLLAGRRSIVIDKNSYDIRTQKYTRKEDFTTTEVHLDTSATLVAFVKPGTLLRQDDPKRNEQLGRSYYKAVSLCFAYLDAVLNIFLPCLIANRLRTVVNFLLCLRSHQLLRGVSLNTPHS